MSNYPGMTFWLAKNYNSFYMNLIDLFSKEEDYLITEENMISFWYFKIRIISNIQNFGFNCYEQKVDNILKHKNIVENYIKEKIKYLIENQIPINVDWINLVLNYIPPELKIINKNIRHFYEFFSMLL